MFSKSWEEDMELNYYWNITDDASKFLSKCDFESLNLNGLKTISDKSAQSLVKFEGDLSLDGLQEISDKTAEALVNFKGNDLCLNSLKTISDKAAEALASGGGRRRVGCFALSQLSLRLNGLQAISKKAAKALSKLKGKYLYRDEWH